jgi:tetratricopeptide (TPR) repeat protein
MQPFTQRADILWGQGRFAEAAGEIRQALTQDPDNARLHAMLSKCLVETEDFQKATDEARLAVHLAPDEPQAHYALANVMVQRNYLDEAQGAVEEAIRLDPQDVDHWSLAASIALERRDWPLALERAERGLEIDAEDVNCTNLRAMALVRLGQKQQAGATIDAALARNPENAISHANQGWTLLHRREPTKAMEHFREALRLDPEMDWARQGIVEALKSRNVIYRWMLAYFLWMSTLSGRAQWGIIIGALVLSRVLRGVARASPELAPYIWVVLGLYYVFVVLTWIAGPLFNLMLRLNRFGRLALSREETIASNWVGACLLMSLAGLASLLVGFGWGLLVAGMFGLLVMPLAATFQLPAGWPRSMMAAYTAMLLAIGVTGIAVGAIADAVATEFWDGIAGIVVPPAVLLFLLGIFVAGFVANALGFARPKR